MACFGLSTTRNSPGSGGEVRAYFVLPEKPESRASVVLREDPGTLYSLAACSDDDALWSQHQIRTPPAPQSQELPAPI
jgi:hypothetical protein